MGAAKPQAQTDIAEYKRALEGQQKGVAFAQAQNWAVPNFQSNGVYIAPTTGTTTTYAANTLVSR